MKNNTAFLRVSALVLIIMLSLPVSAQAATYSSSVFNTLTVQEKIAYLYGMIAQLQLMLEQRGDLDNDSNSSRSRVDVETLSARGIDEDSAELRASIDLNGEDEAEVWFEYGEDDDDLDERTERERVTDNRGDEHTVSIDIDDLDEDERYYFRAVVRDEDGNREYGEIRSFETDGDSGSGSSSGDFEVEVDDTSIDAGDEVRVDWSVDPDDVANQNWVGLYKAGADNRSYVKWLYTGSKESGTLYFTVDSAGDYEFRLFLNNGYDDVATSDEIEVE